MGEVSLRRRHDPVADAEVYEVKLGDEYLMSSLFTAAETELARLGLAAARADRLAVMVGGLGLGYTARTALADPRVTELTVVEALEPVIDWHRRGLVPHAAELTGDERTRIVHGDFFASALAPPEPRPAGHRHDVILLDIDHSPRHLLHPAHAAFYTPAGLGRLAAHLRPGGVFGMWSDDPADDDFLELLSEVFDGTEAHRIAFPNPFQDEESANTVYIGRIPAQGR
ncbi:spermidine synthase [Glycomyces tenuis]|uniref:spermidine synthase n=1 Tax=Glycomyces tenuis TaxID=58116 RepID=UPI0003FAD036|nr:spermidine synthase [Glycomyces tenuis]